MAKPPYTLENDRVGLEQQARYGLRPALSLERLSGSATSPSTLSRTRGRGICTRRPPKVSSPIVAPQWFRARRGWRRPFGPTSFSASSPSTSSSGARLERAGHLEDVSLGGAAVVVAEQLVVGEPIVISIPDASGHECRLAATVMNQRPALPEGFRVGVQFGDDQGWIQSVVATP